MFQVACAMSVLFVGNAQSEQIIEFGDSLTACIQDPNASLYFTEGHDEFRLPDVLPNTTWNSSAFAVGLFAGFGELHPALCAVSMYYIPEITVAGIWAEFAHFWQTCEGEGCGDAVVYLSVLDFLISEEFLVGLPTECQVSREALTELKRGVNVIQHAESHTIQNMTLLALTSIEQSWRIQNAIELFRVGYPFCAGYQTSVALQRVLVEPVLNGSSRNGSHRFSNAQKFTMGFLNGATLAPMVDLQCASSLRFTVPSLVEDLVKPGKFFPSIYMLLQIYSNTIGECVQPGFFRDMEYRPHQNLLADMENPSLLYDTMVEHPLEISAHLGALGLAAKNGDWARSGEELGKMVGFLVYLRRRNSAVHV